MKARLNLALSQKSKSRLERLVALTEAESGAEVIRNALQLYEVMVNHSIGGKEFLIRDKSTGEEKNWPLFLALESEVSKVEEARR